VDERPYRVTASTGGWRSPPWPFWFLDVDDSVLRIRSRGWSWWVRDHDVPRDTIETIHVRENPLGPTSQIRIQDGDVIKVRLPGLRSARKRLIGDLAGRGYPVA
jgi:hypothetical protein